MMKRYIPTKASNATQKYLFQVHWISPVLLNNIIQDSHRSTSGIRRNTEVGASQVPNF